MSHENQDAAGVNEVNVLDEILENSEDNFDELAAEINSSYKKVDKQPTPSTRSASKKNDKTNAKKTTTVKSSATAKKTKTPAKSATTTPKSSKTKSQNAKIVKPRPASTRVTRRTKVVNEAEKQVIEAKIETPSPKKAAIKTSVKIEESVKTKPLPRVMKKRPGPKSKTCVVAPIETPSIKDDR
uniref:Uncharacterized protein n=1 Tax=Strigamia maritima TaxID=126957 RepID=T1J6R1_STRMM